MAQPLRSNDIHGHRTACLSELYADPDGDPCTYMHAIAESLRRIFTELKTITRQTLRHIPAIFVYWGPSQNEPRLTELTEG
jgi:hypothetical protein